MATTIPVTSYPWQPASTITGNLAIGNLRENLLKALKTERGVHTETLLTSIGALAGFAAQNAALDRVTSKERDPANPALSMAIARTKAGEAFLFGDAINVYLLQEPASHLPLIALISGAAIQAGVQPGELPDCREMASHVARVVGGADFGKLRAPKDHAPQHQPLELLRQFWPLARDVMRLPPPKRFFRASEKPLQENHWPIVISIAASQFILMTKEALNPRIGAALIMESAIITSKIDPGMIEPGKWRIAPGEEHKPTFTRLRD